MDPSIVLHKLTAVFTQEGNTCGTTEEYEELVVELDAPDGNISDGFFVVFKTKGWSIDDVSELQQLVDKIDPRKNKSNETNKPNS